MYWFDEQDIDDAVVEAIRTQPLSPLKKLKRSVGYDTEVEETTHKSLKHLKIGETMLEN